MSNQEQDPIEMSLILKYKTAVRLKTSWQRCEPIGQLYRQPWIKESQERSSRVRIAREDLERHWQRTTPDIKTPKVEESAT